MRLRTLFLAAAIVVAPIWAADFHPDLARVGELPRYAVNGAAVAKALASPPARKDLPLRFAVAVAMPLKLADGRWDTLDADTLSWRLRVASAGARLLSFGFDKVQLPPSARLYVYDPNGVLVQGPYTAREAATDGRLWTAVVSGDEAVLELRVAPAERDRLELELGTVYHGYREFSATAKALGDSASCEVDAVCKTASNTQLQDSSRAVALYQFHTPSGGFLCTGQLVNDTKRDDAPYFLSAHHCLSDSSFAPSMILYWNFQNSTCGGNNASMSNSQAGGAVQIATDPTADFTLVRLNQLPATSFNVFYAGWDVSGAVPQSGFDFHHPESDAKKVSTYTSPAQAVNNVPLRDSNGTIIGHVDAWQVGWSQGITEEGSSGSGLLDQNRRVVGVLSGGDTACPGLLGGAPSGTDVFGRLAEGWSNNSALRSALDPCSSGATTLDGKDPGAIKECVASGTTSGGTTGGTTGGNTGSSTGSSSGGGGTLPPWLLLALLPAAALRRRRR